MTHKHSGASPPVFAPAQGLELQSVHPSLHATRQKKHRGQLKQKSTLDLQKEDAKSKRLPGPPCFLFSKSDISNSFDLS